MLRIAVPNKGVLAEAAQTILKEAGYRPRKDSKELVVSDPENSCELFFLRPRDIAMYVGEGMLDAGITGQDMLLESEAPAEEITTLGFGQSTLHFAARAGEFKSAQDLAGLRVATAYPGLLEKHLVELGVDARIIPLDGAVETAIRLGVADAVADTVEPETTLRDVGLETFGDPIMRSEAVLIKQFGAPESIGLRQLFQRLHGVLVARDYVMMDYHIPSKRIDEAIALTPGMEAPTVSPLHGGGWVTVRVTIPRKENQLIMDRLWQIGARALLVTDIYACRLCHCDTAGGVRVTGGAAHATG
jgi:ATP phosphoribosyltransferase